MLNKEKVMDVLKTCFDPEIPINVVDLGLIYEVKVEDNNVNVKMTLTAPGCPMAQFIAKEIESKIKQIAGVKSAKVEIVFDPPWTQDMMSPKAKEMLGIK